MKSTFLKKALLFIFSLFAVATLHSQILDGTVQSARFRVSLPATFNFDDGSVNSSPYVSYKQDILPFIKGAVFAQYNIKQEAFVPQLWVEFSAAKKYYLLSPDETFDLIMTATGVVAVVPTEIAYSMQLQICFAKLTEQGSLSNPVYYDYKPMMFIPQDSEELNLSDVKASSNVNIKDDNSAPLINNAQINGQALIVKQKDASDKNSINKNRVINR